MRRSSAPLERLLQSSWYGWTCWSRRRITTSDRRRDVRSLGASSLSGGRDVKDLSTFDLFDLKHQRRITKQAHEIWRNVVNDDDVLVDATVGLGKDTIVLAGMAPRSRIIGIDVQLEAIEATRDLLFREQLSHRSGPPVVLIHGESRGWDRRYTAHTDSAPQTRTNTSIRY